MSLYLFRDEHTWIHRLDPRIKIISLLLLFAIAVALQHPIATGILFFTMMLLTWSSHSIPNLKRVRLVMFMVLTMAVILWSLFAHGPTKIVGPFTLEGLLYGIGIGLKLGSMIVAGIVLLTTTTNEEIALGLVGLGVPYPVSFAFSTALRMVPMITETVATVIEAQRSRGLDFNKGSLLERIKKYIPVLIPVFAGTFRKTDEFTMALDSKAFDPVGKRTSLFSLHTHPIDWVVLAIVIISLAISIFGHIQGWVMIPGLIIRR
jgi:energy-coupling factor transport system permease protein